MSPLSIDRAGRISRRSGFTLVEVLVAFIILAAFLGVLYQAFSTGLRSIDRTRESIIAAMQAESLSAQAGVSIPLADGDVQGQFPNSHRWRLAAKPITRSEQALEGGPLAFAVTITIFWDVSNKEQSFQLSTIKWDKSP